MGNLSREDGSPVKRSDSDYHKYYQRNRRLQEKKDSSKTNLGIRDQLSRKPAKKVEYIIRPHRELLFGLRDRMKAKKMSKEDIKIIEDMI